MGKRPQRNNENSRRLHKPAQEKVGRKGEIPKNASEAWVQVNKRTLTTSQQLTYSEKPFPQRGQDGEWSKLCKFSHLSAKG